MAKHKSVYTLDMDAETLYRMLTEEPLNISTDTRTLRPESIYIGIKGEQFDGNSFVVQALEKGARYCIIDNPTFAVDQRCILVENTRTTLKDLAKIHRSKFTIPVIAIGGSNGKTTTKELVSAVLSKKYTVHTTKGNLNNDIGVPLTLLAMPRETEIAVIEIGANHPGEHTDLLTILSPTHALITNNGADHLEGFGSLEGVRIANKEIYDWMAKNNGHVFVNKTLTDLVEDSTAVARTLYPAKEVVATSTLYAALSYDGTTVETSLFGSYNEANILAAIAVGEYFDVPREQIRDAIRSYVPTLKRSQVIVGDTYSLVLDCYNANPSSMELALRDFFKDTPAGKRIILIGDMFEMGDAEARVHEEILKLVHTLIDPHDIVLCVGSRFGAYHNDFPFTFFETSETARAYFNTLQLQEKYIFVKASRGMKLEDTIKEKIPL
jgi:UDP-N-acetylmuramoyl-tripeptide--D-alanyl-D-alanine ligase